MKNLLALLALALMFAFAVSSALLTAAAIGLATTPGIGLFSILPLSACAGWGLGCVTGPRIAATRAK